MTMGKQQRNKGASFERMVANDLAERLGTVVKRTLDQARDGGADIHLGNFRIECKSRKRIAILEWLEQAKKACGLGEVPIVIMKADRHEWVVLLRYDDAVPLIQGELE